MFIHNLVNPYLAIYCCYSCMWAFYNAVALTLTSVRLCDMAVYGCMCCD